MPSPESLRTALRDNTREFHLQPVPEGGWDLREVHPTRFAHDASQSAATEFRFEGPHSDQSLQSIVRATGKEPINALRMALNGKPAVDLKEVSLPASGSLKYLGGTEAVIADANWNEVERVPIDIETMRSASLRSLMSVTCAARQAATLKIELRLLNPAIRIPK